MSIAIYEGDFDDLSGGVVFSWFISNPRGPTAFGGICRSGRHHGWCPPTLRPSTKAKARSIPP